MSAPLDLHAVTDDVAARPVIGKIISSGPDVPADGALGYAPGCLFIHDDGVSGTHLYINEGTVASADFNTVAAASAPVEVVTAANVITASESGKIFILNAADGFASTLPAPAAGLRYTFIIGVTPPSSAAHTIVATDAIIQGQVASVPVDDAGVRFDNETTLTLVHTVALEGDRVDLVSDGTNWYASGLVNVVEALTAA